MGYEGMIDRDETCEGRKNCYGWKGVEVEISMPTLYLKEHKTSQYDAIGYSPMTTSQVTWPSARPADAMVVPVTFIFNFPSSEFRINLRFI